MNYGKREIRTKGRICKAPKSEFSPFRLRVRLGSDGFIEKPLIINALLVCRKRVGKSEEWFRLKEMKSEGLADRLKVLIGAGSVLSFAQKCGIGESSIRKYLDGRVPSLDTAEKMASSAGVSLQWLATGEGPMLRDQAAVATARTDEFVGIPRLSARLAAGGGAWNEDDVEVLDHIPFTQDFLSKRLGRLKANGLVILEAEGDSMEPTIADGDLVMIDQRQNRLADGIFAFVLNGVALIKRIHPTLSGGIEVISDNPRYRTEILAGPEADGFQPIGKVVWCGHHFAR